MENSALFSYSVEAFKSREVVCSSCKVDHSLYYFSSEIYNDHPYRLTWFCNLKFVFCRCMNILLAAMEFSPGKIIWYPRLCDGHVVVGSTVSK